MQVIAGSQESSEMGNREKPDSFQLNLMSHTSAFSLQLDPIISWTVE